jgi:hypothetical protein
MTAAGRIARCAAAVCSAVALVTTVGAPPAAAHETTLSVGANTGVLNSAHDQVTLCDNEDDGRGVYAELNHPPLGGVPDRYYDSYGGSCSTYAVTVSPGTFVWMFCEAYGSCDLGFI